MPLDRGPILIALSFGLVMMGHSILVFLLPVALTDVGNNTNAALLALAILGPAQIAGRTAWRYFGTAVRPQDCALIMFCCLCLPAIILLSIGTAPFAIYTALIIQGACYGIHTILRPNLAQCYVAPSQLGRGLGLIAMVGLLMMAVGPAVGGLIWTFTGISGLLCSLLLLNGLALVLGLILRGETLMEANL
jgi:predicted MFS family arabinose efflux permease